MAREINLSRGGVFPYFVDNGKLFFVLGVEKDNRGKEFLNDFGGHYEDGEHQINTSYREFREETNGMFEGAFTETDVKQAFNDYSFNDYTINTIEDLEKGNKGIQGTSMTVLRVWLKLSNFKESDIEPIKRRFLELKRNLPYGASNNEIEELVFVTGKELLDNINGVSKNIHGRWLNNNFYRYLRNCAIFHVLTSLPTYQLIHRNVDFSKSFKEWYGNNRVKSGEESKRAKEGRMYN